MPLKLPRHFVAKRHHYDANFRGRAQDIGSGGKFCSSLGRTGGLPEQIGEAALARLYACAPKRLVERPRRNTPVIPRPAFALSRW
jgi:hypothetical protein